MTQRFSFYEDLTIRENLDFVARMYRRRRRASSAVDKTLDASRPRRRARKQLAGTLSGGWKQRLALAACLLHEPQSAAARRADRRRRSQGAARLLGRDPPARARAASRCSSPRTTWTRRSAAIVIAYIAYGKKLVDGPIGRDPQDGRPRHLARRRARICAGLEAG